MIKFKLSEGVSLPTFGSKYAVGFDVIAHDILKVYKGEKEISSEKLESVKKGFNERGYLKIRSFERVLFNTGLTVADMKEDIELQVRPRSGISLKRGLILANTIGTIDPDYRGIIGVILYNSTPYLIKIEKGERIAQIVPKKVYRPFISFTNTITETERGEGGFGSTGTK